MRILFTTEQYPPETGGVGAVTQGFAHGLAARCHAVSVLSTRRPVAGWTPEPVGGSSDAVVRVRGARGARIRFVKLLPIAWAIRRAIQSEKPQILFASDYRPTGLVDVVLARRKGLATAIYIHGSQLLTESRTPTRLRLLRFAFRNASILVANSQNTARMIVDTVGRLDTPIHVVHPGVDSSRFSPTPEPEGPPVLLSLCRLTRRKGVDLVLDALAALRNEGFSDLSLIVAGDGPCRSDLEGHARRLGLGKNAVRWLGDVPTAQTPSLIARATLLVMASRPSPTELESFGIVYIEAGACGRAVVGTRVGGVPEAILDARTGLLADPDDPRSLADAIARLLRDPALRERMAEEGRRRAESLDWAAQAAQIEPLLLFLARDPSLSTRARERDA
ncbi:glycosyltransferase family 4 protein [Candidatus Sumerlaeota bacterium]|nr:glycosyltransferase family 4 protein [Candidatus Sumerlaeota bacterium]